MLKALYHWQTNAYKRYTIWVNICKKLKCNELEILLHVWSFSAFSQNDFALYQRSSRNLKKLPDAGKFNESCFLPVTFPQCIQFFYTAFFVINTLFTTIHCNNHALQQFLIHVYSTLPCKKPWKTKEEVFGCGEGCHVEVGVRECVIDRCMENSLWRPLMGKAESRRRKTNCTTT